MHIKVEGFIVSETPFKDSSKIINILTKEYGLIGVIVRGAKNIKSPLRAVSQKFVYANFSLLYKKDKLSILVSADVIDPFKNLHNDLTLISYLTYLSDITHQIYKESKSSEIFDLFITTLKKINSGLDPEVLTNILELKYLYFLGVGPDFSQCSVCSKNADIVNIDINTNEALCINCSLQKPIVPIKVIKLLKMYEHVNISSVNDIKIEKELTKIINSYLKNYYDNYTGIYVHSKNYLEKILNEL